MTTKKIVILISILLMSLGISSCSSFRSEVSSRDEKKIGEEYFQKIIEALENKDKEELKSVFSPNALKEAEDIDGRIDYLIEFYKGKISSKEVVSAGSGSKNYGEIKSEIDFYYTVTTDVDTYIIFFIDILEDTKDPDNVGLYMLQIIKASDKDKEFDWGGAKTNCAGIYRPLASTGSAIN